MKTTYKAIPCGCGHRACKAWHVDPVASVQGVRFTEYQARLVAEVLNVCEGIVEEAKRENTP
jgi:hypothetical protein